MLLYILAALLLWPLNAGMLFAEAQGRYPSIAAESVRTDLGAALLIGGLTAVIWPIGTPMAWLMTGFAEYGVWRVK